jgi:hypothetical protein
MSIPASFAFAALTLAAALSACSERPAEPAPATTDRWLGQWTGPEGTFLKLAGGQGRYEVTIRNLDGPRTFAGTAVDRGIVFDRDGSKETLRATDGAGTGMKWLAGKKDCLALKAGEGWCRD